jgi:hypothetical protein
MAHERSTNATNRRFVWCGTCTAPIRSNSTACAACVNATVNPTVMTGVVGGYIDTVGLSAGLADKFPDAAQTLVFVVVLFLGHCVFVSNPHYFA